MQVNTLTLDHWNFHCPVTGEKITSDGEDLHFTPSLKGVWIQEVIEEPELKDTKLEAAWDEFYGKLTEDEDEDALDDFDDKTVDQFLKNYHAPNWLAFKITAGTASFNDTVWFIIDMNATP